MAVIKNILKINCQDFDGKLPPGKYMVTKLLLNRNEVHEKKFKKLSFKKRALTFLTEKKQDDNKLELSFYTSIPEGLNVDNLPESPRGGDFFRDIHDLFYDGNNMYSLEEFKEDMTFYKEVEQYGSETGHNIIWNYPDPVFQDLLDNINLCSGIFLTQGFEEAFLVGPVLECINE